jgi:hypothetical protein
MPTLAGVRHDPLLTNISIQYGPTGHIADNVLPVVPVRLEDGQYIEYDMSRFNTPEAKRNPRTRYKEVDWARTKSSYHAEEYGLEGRIDDRERDNAAAPLDLDETTTEILTDNILNNRERRVANLVLSTSNVTQNTTLSGANQWSDASGGDPIGVAQTAASTIQAATGLLPNSLVLGYKVWNKLITNTKIKAELVEGEQLSLQRLAALFGVQFVYIGTILTTTSKKGQTVTLGDVWGKDALFFYSQPRPSLRRPSFGYQFQVQALKTFRWRDVPVNCDVIRVNEIRAEKLVASALGYLVKAAVA